MADERPIGVFDSGVGGLTVLRAIQDRCPGESTVYLGDLARCPYGPRDQDEVRDFAIQIADFLADIDIKLLVVACNTATAAAFSILRKRYPFPVLGVIGPGAAEAVATTRNGRIGVVATDGTVASGAYCTSIQKLQPGTVVVQRSASWLVPVIERGPWTHTEVEMRLTPTLAEMRDEEIDTLILGCTHFPLVRDIFQAGIGPGVAVVDSAATTAREVVRLLEELELRAQGCPRHRLLVTGPASAFSDRSRAMFHTAPSIEPVDLGSNCVL